ncbi:MAG: hypothetical protein WCZ89_10280 [Phycisphaerae bacterium]
MSDTKECLNSSMCLGGEISSRTMRLCKLSTVRVELRKSFLQYALYFSLLIIPFSLGPDILKPNDYAFWHKIIRWLIVLVPLSISLIGLTIGFRLRKIIIDKDLGTIEIVPGLTGKRKTFTFEQIQYLQLFHHRVGEDGKEHCYEINLVFNTPNHERYNLACYENSSTAKKIIEQLAEFINKPFSFAGLLH